MYLQISGKATKIINIISACLVILIVSLLTSCADLGEYSEQKDYYETFDSVRVYDSSFSYDSYDMEDFYNDDMMEKFTCPIEFDKYTCFVIEIDETIHLDSFAIFFQLEGLENSKEVIKKRFAYTCYCAKDLDFINTLKSLSNFDLFYGSYIAEGHKILCDGLGHVKVTIGENEPQIIEYTTGENDGYNYMEFEYKVSDTKTDKYYISLQETGMVVYRNLFPTAEKYKYVEFLDEVYVLFTEEIEIKSDDFNGIETSSFYDEDKNIVPRIDIEKGNYLIITVNNNIFGHEKRFLENVNIKMTGLMVRSSLKDD